MCLTASESNSTGYINASYVTVRAASRSRLRFSARVNPSAVSLTSPAFPQGHHHCREFIVSQTPLGSTVADFWRMIWEHNTHTVVRLPDAHGQVNNNDEQNVERRRTFFFKLLLLFFCVCVLISVKSLVFTGPVKISQ